MAAASDWKSEFPFEQGERILEIGFSDDRVGLQVGDVSGLRAFREASFDKVVGLHVIESWGEAYGDLCELHRVLRPGGRLLLGLQRGLHVEPLLRDAGFDDIHTLHRIESGSEITWTGARRSG